MVNRAVNITVVSAIEITAMIFLDLAAFKLRKLRRRMHFLLATFISITAPCHYFAVLDADNSVCKLSDLLVVGYHYNGLGELLARYL